MENSLKWRRTDVSYSSNEDKILIHKWIMRIEIIRIFLCLETVLTDSWDVD